MKELTAIELRKVINELKQLEGALLNQIYQPNSHTLLLKLRSSIGNEIIKIDSGVGVFLTKYKHSIQRIPPHFCSRLRKFLLRSKLIKISQVKMDRIVEFVFERKNEQYVLVCELFSKGNFILKKEDKIIICAAPQHWKSREIKKGVKYIYPPLNKEILSNKKELKKYFEKQGNKKCVTALSQLGFGGLYAEEICNRNKIKKEESVSKIDIEKLSSAVVKSQDLFLNSKAVLVKDKDNLIDATLIRLSKYKEYENIEKELFNDALDIYYSTIEAKTESSNINQKFNKEKEKLERIISAQEKQLKLKKEKLEKLKQSADAIYTHYNFLKELFFNISKMNKQKIRDLSLIKKEIKKVDMKNKEIIIELPENQIKLNYSKTIEENANEFYSLAKKEKLKISRIEKVVQDTKKELKNLKEKGEKLTKSKVSLQKIQNRQKQWYEKFRWFYTSGGLLSIGGRDATQNDILIKKHAEKNDLIFHTEMAGSPFFILKNGKLKAKKTDLEEVAVAVASFSRAWKLGIASVDVFYVLPEQVTKEAKAGEYLSKGSFMIKGKKTFLRNTELQLAVGLKNNVIIVGPERAIKNQTKNFIKILPGNNKKSDISKKIALKFNIKNLNEIDAMLPTGGIKIV